MIDKVLRTLHPLSEALIDPKLREDIATKIETQVMSMGVSKEDTETLERNLSRSVTASQVKLPQNSTVFVLGK